MKKLLLSTVILSLLISCNTKETNKIYYQSNTGGSPKDSIERTKMDLEAKEFFSRSEKIPIDSIYIEHTNLDTITRNDSIIITYKSDTFYGKPTKEEKEQNQRYDDFINSLMNKPFFTEDLKMLNGKVFNENSLNSKPTLVNLWFTTCAPCIVEMPYLNELKEKYKDQVNFVSITYNSKEDVEKFLNKRAFNFTHIIDAQDFLNQKNVSQYPFNIFLDKKGIVKNVEPNIPMLQDENGNVSADISSFEKQLNKLL